MEVLRVPPYPITTTWDVPLPNTTYSIYVEDLVDHSFETSTAVSTANSKLVYVMPRTKVQFDREFLFKIYDSTGEIVVDDNLSVYRPLVDPNTLSTVASEIAEYKELEIVARSIIDTYINDGSAYGDAFYNHKLIIQSRGEGADYFPVWHNLNKILKVYENNVLVYDSDNPSDYEYQYIITLDNSAIMRVETDVYNRAESAPPTMPVGVGDLGFFGFGGVAFPSGADYIFIVDAGYKTVPPDVEIAAKKLIMDLKYNNNDYYSKFIQEYSTDQFDIKFAPQFLKGTGNIFVDKILDKYKGTVFKTRLM